MKLLSEYSFVPSPENVDELYRSLGMSYPKFFKMDLMSKASLLAAERVLLSAGLRSDETKPDMAVVLVNSTSSAIDDIEFQKTISKESFFPSPSLFVYTLPNVACAEIAIRNRIMGETSFYLRSSYSEDFLFKAAGWAFSDSSCRKVLCGWTECLTDTPLCRMMLLERDI